VTTSRNVAGNAPSGSIARRGEDQKLRLFPGELQVFALDDPDDVRINTKFLGWANPRQFGDVWLALQFWR
jgi:hypothetical protein